MKSLYLRIWLTVVAALLLFALVSGWLVQRHLEQERGRIDAEVSERVAAWGEMIQRTLPGPETEVQVQSEALQEWSQRLRLPLALDDARGQRIGASESFLRRDADSGGGVRRRAYSIRLDDGRTLWVMRPGAMRPPMRAGDDLPPGLRAGGAPRMPPPWFALGGFGSLSGSVGLAALLMVLFIAVAAGAYPVVRRLTRRLESLKRGVEAFGRGALHQRVDEGGRDEVAAVAFSFNRAAERIETLVRSHQSLLANASHEFRSPLTRMKMALSMFDEAPPAQRDKLRHEIHTDIAELDALVEEVLLASRLDATGASEHPDRVDLLALAAEEASRVKAQVDGVAVTVAGEERLLRRALRNLLENARRYAGDQVVVEVRPLPTHPPCVEVRVCDRGPGVPELQRERIFEPFYRLPGHAELSGGVGLGLSLVRQIAQRHGGRVHCEPREGGGSCFVLTLPVGA